MNCCVDIIVFTNRAVPDMLYAYEIPSQFLNVNLIGYRVVVPFGADNCLTEGVVVQNGSLDSGIRLKRISHVVGDGPVLTPLQIQQALWIRERTLSQYKTAFKLFMPPYTSIRAEKYMRIIGGGSTDSSVLNNVLALAAENGGEVSFAKIKQALGLSPGKHVYELVRLGLAEVFDVIDQPTDEKYAKVVCFLPEPSAEAVLRGKNAQAQIRALEILATCDYLSVNDLMEFADCTRHDVNMLVKKKLAAFTTVEVLRSPTLKKEYAPTVPLPPTSEQKEAITRLTTALESGERHPFLIHGVTGSGKTEVYLQVISHCLRAGKTCIVLVPEISLTPQMLERFLSRFGQQIAILHSSLSIGERYDEYMRIKKGDARIVVGARSAIFAPLTNLGMIIIDEEHESSYKSEASPRYHTRDVALKRCEDEGGLLVLASATPSVESYHKAQNGEYALIELRKRVNSRSLPTVEVVDMRNELVEGNKTIFSKALKQEILKNLENNEQTVLFLNRRGHSTFVSCRKCGYVCNCPNCSITLTYHAVNSSLACHYCGHISTPPIYCPQCNSSYIRYFGTGTQRIEALIREEFPEATLLRMDLDTTGGKNQHEKLFAKFENEKVDILIGTQMVSKGLDFPLVTLVGVLAADALLNFGDFRAGERAFSLMTQVCGRAGRAKHKGRAIIQTYDPDNVNILLAKDQDYIGFYYNEIVQRKATVFPPFCDIITVTVTDSDIRTVKEVIVNLYNQVNRNIPDITLFRPTPSQVSKINNRYRWHFWFKCYVNPQLLHTMQEISQQEDRALVVVDVNPNVI